MKRFRVVGQSVPRVDAVEKVTGRARYTGDLVVPGMLHGKILRSPLPHARIRSIDARRAEELPGVVAVLTGADVADIDPYYGHGVKDRPLIALDKVRYAGEPVVAVAAETELVAEEALELIQMDYEVLPAVLNMEEALGPGAPVIHEKQYRLGDYHEVEDLEFFGYNICYHGHYEHGSVEAGFAEADAVFEDTFRFPMVYHYAMEPHTVIAAYDDGITVWSSAQHPFLVRAELAEMFGEPLTRVRVVVPYLGGGYGSKSYAKIEPLVVALARKAGRPVRVALSVAEAMQTVRRHAAILRFQTGVKRDGTIVARECTVHMDTGAYADNGPRVTEAAVARAFGPYRYPHARCDAYAVYTNTTPAGSFRSVAGPQTTWANESHLDMIAERLGIDPLTLRLKNLPDQGEEVIPHGGRPMDTDLSQGLRAVAEAIGWEEPASPEVGRGLALIAKGGGASPVSTALVRLQHDGSVVVNAGSTELGQGVRTVLSQIAAEELQVPMEQVRVMGPDTGNTPFDRSTGAGRSTTLMGLAVQAACRELGAQVLDVAAEVLEVPRETLALADGQVQGGDGRRSSYAEVLRGYYGIAGGELMGRGYVSPRFEGGRLQAAPVFWEAGWGAAEIEVDDETGVIHLRRYVSAADVGRAINPALAEGQDEGATFMGIGHTFFEAMRYEDGQLINNSLMDYRVPVMGNLPDDFRTILIENGNGPGPYGSKGMGESGIGSVGPAVANALARLTGVRITELPLTPDRVWQALREREDLGPELSGDNARAGGES